MNNAMITIGLLVAYCICGAAYTLATSEKAARTGIGLPPVAWVVFFLVWPVFFLADVFYKKI